MSHWKHAAQLLLRELDTELRDTPIYLFDACEADDSDLWLRPGQRGSTSCWLDLRLSEQLKRSGEWAGRGFAALIDSERVANWNDLWGVCIHEAAHYLSAPAQVDTAEPEQAAAEISELLASLADAVGYTPPATEAEQNHAGHGKDFVRAAAHLAYRAANIAAPIRPELAHFGEKYHRGVTEATVMQSLRRELRSCQGMRIRTILKTNEPMEFSRLFD